MENQHFSTNFDSINKKTPFISIFLLKSIFGLLNGLQNGEIATFGFHLQPHYEYKKKWEQECVIFSEIYELVQLVQKIGHCPMRHVHFLRCPV